MHGKQVHWVRAYGIKCRAARHHVVLAVWHHPRPASSHVPASLRPGRRCAAAAPALSPPLSSHRGAWRAVPPRAAALLVQALHRGGRVPVHHPPAHRPAHHTKPHHSRAAQRSSPFRPKLWTAGGWAVGPSTRALVGGGGGMGGWRGWQGWGVPPACRSGRGSRTGAAVSHALQAPALPCPGTCTGTRKRTGRAPPHPLPPAHLTSGRSMPMPKLMVATMTSRAPLDQSPCTRLRWSEALPAAAGRREAEAPSARQPGQRRRRPDWRRRPQPIR